jgi:hypothetical protein
VNPQLVVVGRARALARQAQERVIDGVEPLHEIQGVKYFLEVFLSLCS